MPKGLRGINVTDYVPWDINKMIEIMKSEIGWQTPDDPILPMRFDCKIEESLINNTFSKACGCTVHGIICNNLILGKLKTKEELNRSYDLYEKEIRVRKKEVMETLNIKKDL